MGCTTSNFSYDSSDSSYEASRPRRSTPRKRNFSSRVQSTATSGLCTDDGSNASRHYSTSSWSHCSTPPPSNRAASAQHKRSAFPKLSRKDMPKALAKLTLSTKMTKDILESPPPRQQRHVLERSYGYFSGSTDNMDSSYSSFSDNSLLLHTRDMSKSYDISTNSSDASQHHADEPVSNLKMEILMMRENIQLMPKTSSPFCMRRDTTTAYNGNVNYVNYTPPSDTYCLWRQYLQGMPAYSLQNVTAIPEAIAGQFSPPNHPAYTALQNFECVSAPKRYRIEPKKHVHSAPTCVPLAAIVPDYGVTRTIESTEL